MEEYGDFRSRRQHTVWHSLNRLLVALISFTFITVIACLFVPELKNVHEQSDYSDNLRAEIQKGFDSGPAEEVGDMFERIKAEGRKRLAAKNGQ